MEEREAGGGILKRRQENTQRMRGGPVMDSINTCRGAGDCAEEKAKNVSEQAPASPEKFRGNDGVKLQLRSLLLSASLSASAA